LSRRISYSEDHCRGLLFFFSTEFGATWQVDGPSAARGSALGLLSTGLFCLQFFFQVVSERCAESWILCRVIRFALKTLAAAADWLRLDVHQRVLAALHPTCLQHFTCNLPHSL